MTFLTPIHDGLIKPTSFLGLKLWVIILVLVVFLLCPVILIALYFLYRRRRRRLKPSDSSSKNREPMNLCSCCSSSSMKKRLLSGNLWQVEMTTDGTPEKKVTYSDKLSAQNMESGSTNLSRLESRPRNEFTLAEIDFATSGWADENLIGNGDFGLVYRGILMDGTCIAVKKLIANGVRAEDFRGEVETLLCIRHKNLVKLLGYCDEGDYKMLVHEYQDNGNLKQWLHESMFQVSPLSWNIRMNIILGVAKGLAYLHEDFEPGIVHQNLKSSNIMLDKQWNPKISDIGVNKLIGFTWTRVISPPTGMSGFSYLAPEYAYTGILDEKTDVYSFGILIMEIISGKRPIQYTVTEIEEHLVDWIKCMVENQQYDAIVDPRLPEIPSLKELKRILLIAVRCVDPEIDNRPKMGEIIHMLEPRDLLLSDVKVLKRETSRRCVVKEDQVPSS